MRSARSWALIPRRFDVAICSSRRVSPSTGCACRAMAVRIAAEVLGCSLSRVKVVAADTDLPPIDIGSYASRVTFMAGNATLRAAEEVKKQIASAAARKMNCAVEDLVFRDDSFFQKS